MTKGGEASGLSPDGNALFPSLIRGCAWFALDGAGTFGLSVSDIMKIRVLTALAVTVLVASFAFADEPTATEKAMKFAHKAPKGEKKLNEKIVEGTADEADVKKALELYKAMVDDKPPKGEAADFKAKTLKLIAATEEVVAKNPAGVAHYKDAVNCKACHSEHKPN